MEIESKQGKIARKTAKKHFSGSQITLITDFAGHERILRIQTHEN
jgi:hypothetical protein